MSTLHTKEELAKDLQLQLSKRIYVLGIGNLGKLFAHALAAGPSPPPLTLLLHRPTLYEEWVREGRTIEIIHNGVSQKGGVFDVDPIDSAGIINHLIVTTKAQHTAEAIQSIKHRLLPSSTLLFLQNGMGTVDEVNEKVFQHLPGRPNYLIGITSHGVYSNGPFSSVLAGRATATVGSGASSQTNGTVLDSPNTESYNYLLHQVQQPELLNMKQVSHDQILQLQLEKLVMNATINPLTVIFDCKNGELFKIDAATQYMEKLLAEASQVICSLSELAGRPEVKERFSTTRLKQIVLDIANVTARNTSSMRQDVQAGKKTEIDYINGYIVKKGKELGVRCPINEGLVQQVREVEDRQHSSAA
ncbi:2-dehydropantoate 2-reductase protein [Rutstroemia sp. NJR-2017a BVV2]|nr:2-dehydropantoate 2-reductase protein [Rutstroemia sp. NJR-2017a BVV2]